MNDLQFAFKEPLCATQDVSPVELEGEDLELWHLCDRRIEQIIDRLVSVHDEAGPAAREILAKVA